MPLHIRPFEPQDLDAILDIAVAAWQPIFDSGRNIVGDELFDQIYKDSDARKRSQVKRACDAKSSTLVWVAEIEDEIVGFITLDMDTETLVGEIGNNAVATKYQGRGIGSDMYRFVTDRMTNAGMTAAVVTTGGDDAHAPARRAYENVGFSGPIPSVKYHIKL